jgi:hypothetical protein
MKTNLLLIPKMINMVIKIVPKRQRGVLVHGRAGQGRGEEEMGNGRSSDRRYSSQRPWVGLIPLVWPRGWDLLGFYLSLWEKYMGNMDYSND